LQAARAANDVLRFLLELLALAGLALWGWRTGPTGVNVVLAIAAPLTAAALWGAFVAPKARRHPGDPWRLLLEVVVFGAGTLAFAGGRSGLGRDRPRRARGAPPRGDVPARPAPPLA
jgi:hypothetical protein